MRKAPSIVILMSASLLLAGCEAPPPEAKAVRPVRTVVAKAEAIGEVITQTGEIRARFETPLGFRIPGELQSRLDVGRTVAAGEVIAVIDSIPARNDVLSSAAEVEVAEAAVALAEQTVQRVQDLFSRSVATRVQVLDAEANLRTTRARLDLARTNRAKATETLSYTELRAPMPERWPASPPILGRRSLPVRPSSPSCRPTNARPSSTYRND